MMSEFIPCNTRRMAATAAHLTHHVLPDLPLRQWVLAVPKRVALPAAYGLREHAVAGFCCQRATQSRCSQINASKACRASLNMACSV